jgi:Uma2 family endonuclease
VEEETAAKFEDDCCFLPEECGYELIEGEVVKTHPPDAHHQEVAGNLFCILWGFVKKKRLGKVYYAPIDVVLSPENVVRPDIFLVDKRRLGIIKKKNVQGSPDLIIEILSTVLRDREKLQKRRLYHRYGVKEYWIADPQKKMIEQMWLIEGGYRRIGTYEVGDTMTSLTLKGLKVRLRDVF